jgi:tRNA-specific 2-thiouridylase
MTAPKKVAMLVSGGVDSSVALRLLHQEGHDITAYYLKIWLEDELAFLGDCPWEEDLTYIRAICDEINVPLRVISLQREYWSRVIDYAIAELKEGRTPNPDIFCNRRIKFGSFFDHIDDTYDLVATGHYARVDHQPHCSYLKTAVDTFKDQTYFLAYLTQEQVRRAYFPIGKYPKAHVRELANEFALPNSKRKDSQGLCFLGTISFREFVKHHLGEQPGPFVELETGRTVGEHKGFWFYTIGQRQGLGLSGGPWYVIKKDVHENVVFISRQYHAEDKRRDNVDVAQFNWISDIQPKAGESFSCRVKVRHGEATYGAEVTMTGDDTANVQLDNSDQGLAPGQFVVFYQDDTCLGGAMMVS